MSQQTIDNSGTTDTLAAGFGKVNDNFTEVYASIIKTGMMIDYWGSAAPSGWILSDGGTIGKSGSGASNRANDDTQTLFTLLWNAVSDTYCPVSGGRGASASADFSAGKTLTIPNAKGRTTVGLNAASAFSYLGLTIGSETHSLIEAELPSHTHTYNETTASGGATAGSDENFLKSGLASSVSTGSTGSGTAHNNIQPSITCNKIIKL